MRGLFCLLAFFVFVADTRAQSNFSMKGQVIERTARHYPELEDLYMHLHQNPEVSGKEVKTSAIMVRELKALGLEVHEGIGGFGVAAVLRNGKGPVVLVRADMDGLPVEEKTGLPYASKVKSLNGAGQEVSVMHACGHDVHMTVLVGTARILVETKKNWRGTVVFVAQPSEENGLGAEAMLEDGLYDRMPYPDYALALHNHAGMKAGTVGYSSGPFMASVDMMDITVYGKGGHGAAPHETIDPIVLSSQMVLAFQTIVSREINPLEPAVITVGSVHGGTGYNIIPDEVKLQLTLRSYSKEVRTQIIQSIQEKTKFLALQAGLSNDRFPVITYNDSAPATLNDPELTLRLVELFRNVLGAQNVLEMQPSMVGEDFSRLATYKQPVPYVMFWLGTVQPDQFEDARIKGAPLPSLHSSTFRPMPKATISTGVISMTAAVLDLLD